MSSSSSPAKASWPPAFHKAFVDVCLREMMKMNEPGARIAKEGWRNIVGAFYSKTGVRYTKTQIKNHYDATRKMWKVWVQLTDDSSMKWDPETKKFGATEEQWRNYIQEVPIAAQFQSKEIQFKDQLDIIYDEGIRLEAIQSGTKFKWLNDTSGSSPLHGKERVKKRKHAVKECDSDEDWLISKPTSKSKGKAKAKEKANWTPAYHKIFIDSCIEEVLKGNKTGTHFTKEGWRNIAESFFEETGERYDKTQIKNHFDSTRKQWKVWVKLIGDDRMNWDPETKTFGASEEEWLNYIKEIPEAAQFQFKELQLSDKLDILFDESLQTGEMETLASLKRHNDTSATSSLSGKERGKRHKNVGTDFDYKGAIVLNATPISTIASDQSMSSSSYHKVKASWTPLIHQIFVDICLQETLKGNKPGTHFTKEGWKNIMENFYWKTGLNYDRLQLKNHWDNMKDQWKVWCKLINTSYMKWDPSNHKFEASDEDWTNYLQANPEAAQFRVKELPFTDMLETIFNGTTVIGETEPAAQPRKSDDSVITFPLHAKEEPDTDCLDMPTECLYDDAVASKNGVSIQKNAVGIPSPEGKRNYSIGECIECLDGMEEMEQGSDLYLFALDVFLKQEYREIFLQLKTPNLRISWLQRLQSAGQPSL